MLLSENEAKAICDQLLSCVEAEDAQVSVQSEEYSHLRFAGNAMTTSGRRDNVTVHVTVWVDKKKGSASTNETDAASLAALVKQAEHLAAVSPEDREYLPTLGPQSYKPVQGYVEATANISLGARARAIGEVIGACEDAGVIGAGFHQSLGSADASATKNGNFHYGRTSLVSLSLTARASEGNGSGYFMRNHFDVTRLDTARVAREAVRKCLDSRESRPLDAGVYSVVLEPQAVADLLGSLPFLFDARSADEGRSPFAAPGGKTRAGERIFDPRITVYSDPWHPELPGSSAAAAGIPAERLDLVRDGVLENLVYSRFWAQEKEREPTPGPVNLILKSSDEPARLDAMIQETRKGLLVGRFWYIRPVDRRTALFTGLTRDGVWYIENGNIQYPVRNFRFNQSLLELLAPGNVERIGAPERVGSSESQGSAAAMLPALQVREFHFSSQSEAV